MFCKIRKGKKAYSIYACSRQRIAGKVVSKDIKVCDFAWHSLYEDDEEINGLIEDVPASLMRIVNGIYLKNKDIELDFDDVVEKLIKVKKEYYPTYKEEMIKIREMWEIDERKRQEKELQEYEDFKSKYRTLYNKEIAAKYQEGYKSGYEKGLNDGLKFEDKFFNNRCSGNKVAMNEEEKKLLKEAFKMLSMKHHPDRGGSTEKMTMVNNLKEKILK